MPLTLGCFILIFLVPWDIKLGCFRFFLFLEVWTLSLWTSLLELLLLHPISFSMLNFHFHIWKYFFYLLEWATVSLWSEVAQSCPTLCNPVDGSQPGSSVHGILQARILEWVAISFSKGSSRPRDRTQVSCIAGRCFNLWATREASSFSKLWHYSDIFILLPHIIGFHKLF